MRANHFVVVASIALAIIALDQLSKTTVSTVPTGTLVFQGLVEIAHTQNRGAAFGLLRNVPGSAVILTLTTIITIVLLIWIFRPLVRTHLWGGRVALGLIFGGALSNLADRVALGHVRDFIKLHLRIIDWPAFNVADMAIVLGIILLLLGLASLPKHARAPADAATSTPAEPAATEQRE